MKRRTICLVAVMALLTMGARQASATLYTIPGTNQSVDIQYDPIFSTNPDQYPLENYQLTDQDIQNLLGDLGKYPPNRLQGFKRIIIGPSSSSGSTESYTLSDGIGLNIPDIHTIPANRSLGPSILDFVFGQFVQRNQLSDAQIAEYAALNALVYPTQAANYDFPGVYEGWVIDAQNFLIRTINFSLQQKGLCHRPIISTR